MLNTKFPGCGFGLKAIPHIESKLKWFKDKYAVVSEMLNKTSSFQWDDQAKMIQCEKQAYDDFCKNHPKAGGLWRTPFPYLDKLDLIFGFMKGMSSHLATIANAMSSTENRETDVAEQKKKLLSEIAGLPGITKAEAIRAVCLFSANPSQRMFSFQVLMMIGRKKWCLTYYIEFKQPIKSSGYKLDVVEEFVVRLMSIIAGSFGYIAPVHCTCFSVIFDSGRHNSQHSDALSATSPLYRTKTMVQSHSVHHQVSHSSGYQLEQMKRFYRN